MCCFTGVTADRYVYILTNHNIVPHICQPDMRDMFSSMMELLRILPMCPMQFQTNIFLTIGKVVAAVLWVVLQDRQTRVCVIFYGAFRRKKFIFTTL